MINFLELFTALIYFRTSHFAIECIIADYGYNKDSFSAIVPNSNMLRLGCIFSFFSFINGCLYIYSLIMYK